MRTEIAKSIALTLLRSELAGYRGYPNSEAGEDRFARELATVAISVDHATSIVEAFEETFPTIKELRDTASNLRVKFEESERDRRKEWERIYGKPQPVPVTFAGSSEGQRQQSEMWLKLRVHLGVRDFAKVSFGAIYQAMQDLGYSLTAEQEDARLRSSATPRPVAAHPPVTSEDVERAVFQAHQQADGWEDPDR